MPFEPFPLLDFDRGLYKAKESWIAPKNAFTILENVRVRKGRLEKRPGYKALASLDLETLSEAFGDGGSSDTHTILNLPLSTPTMLDDPDDPYTIQISDGPNSAEVFTDQATVHVGYFVWRLSESIGAGGLTRYTGSIGALSNPRSGREIVFEDNSGTPQVGTVQYITGTQFGDNAPVQSITGTYIDPAGTNTWSPPPSWIIPGDYDVTFANPTVAPVTVTYDCLLGTVTYATGYCSVSYIYHAPGVGWANPVLIDYLHVSGNPVMGICNFITRAGTEYLVACDTRRIYKFNTTTGRFDDVLGADEWAGTDADFFDFAAFEDILIINNGVDAPKKYDPVGGTVNDMGTDYDADTVPDIDSAKFCFRHKNRIVYLRTEEGSVDYGGRARWTPVNSIEYAGGTGDEASYYTDAPTNDRIISAGIVNDQIVATFERSVWQLRYTGGDPFSAYRWEQIPSLDGAAAPRGSVSLGPILLFRGREGIRYCDGIRSGPIDIDIPDLTFDWNQDAEKYSYAIYVPADREVLLSYADFGDTYPENVLAIQLDQLQRVQGFSIYDLPFHCFGRYRRGSVTTWDDVATIIDDIDRSWDSYAQSVGYPIILAGGRDSIVYQYAEQQSDNGVSINGVAHTIRLNPYPFAQVHLGWIDIIADSQDGGTLTVYVYKDYDPSPYYSATLSLTPTISGGEKVSRRVRPNQVATFHVIKVLLNGTQSKAIDAITPFCKPVGRILEVG